MEEAPIQTTYGPNDLTALVVRAADTLIAETARCIRDYPLSAAATAFGGGLLVGWLIAHNLKRPRYAGREAGWLAAVEDEANRRAISTWENEGGASRGLPQYFSVVADRRQ